MNRLSIAIIFLLCTGTSAAIAQSVFNGVLYNAIDSSIIPGAAITVKENHLTLLTGAHAEFHFPMPPGSKYLTFNIEAIGAKVKLVYKLSFAPVEKVYVDVIPENLNDFELVALSARQVVEKAIAAIPDNYTDSSCFAYSSYRQYKKVNGVYRNLIEARPVVMFQVHKTGKGLTAKEAFAVKDFRRSNYWRYIDDYPPESDAADLMVKNPVYHLEESSLKPAKLNNYIFWFDTTIKSTGCYLIRYYCRDCTNESHGIGNYSPIARFFRGEGYEKGELKIDRNSFAFIKIERNTIRYPEFSYYFKPNLVKPENLYTIEFIDGRLIAEYQPVKGKWHLKTLCNEYSNEFYRVKFETKDYVISDYYEWQADSFSRYIPEALTKRFFYHMPGRVYNYDSTRSNRFSFPFYFCNRDSVYKDIERTGPLETQFYKMGIKPDD